MKKYILFTFVMMAAVVLSSFDSNKGKVKDLTEYFVSAVNSNDKAAIYDLYSAVKDLKNAKIPTKIVEGDITVEKFPQDSTSHLSVIHASRAL